MVPVGDGTVSAPLHLLQRGPAQGLVGQLQLVPQAPQVPLRLGLDDAQLRVDVLVLVRGVLLILQEEHRLGLRGLVRMARPATQPMANGFDLLLYL